MFVLDASIVAKLFRDESDSHLARMAIEHYAERSVRLIAPGFLLYEVLAVALHYDVPFDLPIRLIADLKQIGFTLPEPGDEELRCAERIATTRTANLGFPELKDSIYHAMAINRGATFLTADRRHFEKTHHLGSICLLVDWKPD